LKGGDAHLLLLDEWRVPTHPWCCPLTSGRRQLAGQAERATVDGRSSDAPVALSCAICYLVNSRLRLCRRWNHYHVKLSL